MISNDFIVVSVYVNSFLNNFTFNFCVGGYFLEHVYVIQHVRTAMPCFTYFEILLTYIFRPVCWLFLFNDTVFLWRWRVVVCLCSHLLLVNGCRMPFYRL